jgi:hypothetical protein
MAFFLNRIKQLAKKLDFRKIIDNLLIKKYKKFIDFVF